LSAIGFLATVGLVVWCDRFTLSIAAYRELIGRNALSAEILDNRNSPALPEQIIVIVVTQRIGMASELIMRRGSGENIRWCALPGLNQVNEKKRFLSPWVFVISTLLWVPIREVWIKFEDSS
jgi:thymidylate kinase